MSKALYITIFIHIDITPYMENIDSDMCLSIHEQQ